MSMGSFSCTWILCVSNAWLGAIGRDKHVQNFIYGNIVVTNILNLLGSW